MLAFKLAGPYPYSVLNSIQKSSDCNYHWISKILSYQSDLFIHSCNLDASALTPPCSLVAVV